jgi:hypothetical protein
MGCPSIVSKINSSTKVIAVAEQRHLNHNNPDELIELIASEMQKRD